MVPLKCLSNLQRTPEMPLITLYLNWSGYCVMVATNQAAQAITFSITDSILYVSVVSQDNAELFEKLKSGFKRTNNWNKYQTKV